MKLIHILIITVIVCLATIFIWFLNHDALNTPQAIPEKTHEIINKKKTEKANVPISINKPVKPGDTELAEQSNIDKNIATEDDSDEIRERLFDNLLTIFENTSNSDKERLEALAKLHDIAKKNLSADKLKKFWDLLCLFGKNLEESPKVTVEILYVLKDIGLVMKERGVQEGSIIEDEADFVVDYISDTTLDPEVRRMSMRTAGDLRLTRASQVIGELLSVTDNINTPVLIRPACIALQQIDGDECEQEVTRVLQETESESVFGTAAYVLGKVHTVSSMQTLLKNRGRLNNWASADNALQKMPDLIIDTLITESDEKILVDAIHATDALWKEEQKAVYQPELEKLVKSGPSKAKKAALEKLIDDAEHLPQHDEDERLKQIIGIVNKDDPGLQPYLEKMPKLINAKHLEPVKVEALSPELIKMIKSESKGRKNEKNH